MSMLHRFLGRPKVRITFEKRDLWVGVYWNAWVDPQELRLYICIVPMLPIIVRIPFRPRVWPYYHNRRWYPKGNAPIKPIN